MPDMANKPITTRRIGLLPLDGFALMSYASLIEPMRAANLLAGHTLYEMILRAGADRQEGFARNAGALLTSRLKDAELWGWLRDAPPLRVGSPPSRGTA